MHEFARRWLSSLLLLAACQEPEQSELDEGWSGTPPAEPAEIGEACESTWVPCVEGAYCAQSDPHIELCVDVGICAPQPLSCDDTYDPICGCDGELYGNPCEAAKAGVGSRGSFGCDPPEGSFSCGSSFCALDSEYCEYIIGHGQLPAWSCLPLPCDGGLSGCACLAEPLCPEEMLFAAEYCQETESGGVVVGCVPP